MTLQINTSYKTVNDYLTDDLVGKTISYLDLKSMGAAARVCISWNNIWHDPDSSMIDSLKDMRVENARKMSAVCCNVIIPLSRKIDFEVNECDKIEKKCKENDYEDAFLYRPKLVFHRKEIEIITKEVFKVFSCNNKLHLLTVESRIYSKIKQAALQSKTPLPTRPLSAILNEGEIETFTEAQKAKKSKCIIC